MILRRAGVPAGLGRDPAPGGVARPGPVVRARVPVSARDRVATRPTGGTLSPGVIPRRA
ncbi:hypothetical protein GCM10010271_22240 [Streptomyces kurssanovii]|nr:hypothetical protein GCM10010271_22240 [Streptomyces kurssanovii]